MRRILCGLLLGASLVSGCGMEDDVGEGSGAAVPISPLGVSPTVTRPDVMTATLRVSELRAVRVTARAIYARRVIVHTQARMDHRYQGGQLPPWASPGDAPMVATDLRADAIYADTVETDLLDATEVHAQKIEIAGVQTFE